MAVFVNEGKLADLFRPGLYTLNTQTLPLLTNLMNWDKKFQSPFKSDIYFFSSRLQTAQKWGTATPITFRDKEFGAVRLRGYGIYAWHVFDPRVFHAKVSGTRDMYRVVDIETQLRNTIVSRMTDVFASSSVPFLDMAANQVELAHRISEAIKPTFAGLGLSLDSFVVESLSLPEELQKALDARIGMNMVGDLSRYAQYQIANSVPVIAANEGGAGSGIGAGVGLGAGIAAGQVIAQQVVNAVKPADGASSGATSTGTTVATWEDNSDENEDVTVDTGIGNLHWSGIPCPCSIPFAPVGRRAAEMDRWACRRSAHDRCDR